MEAKYNRQDQKYNNSGPNNSFPPTENSKNSTFNAPQPVNRTSKLANFLARNNDTFQPGSAGMGHLEFGLGERNLPVELARSSSAPPAERLFIPSILDLDEDIPRESISESDPRFDPSYPAFFHSKSRLDPRLPPPFYSPGQSWQQLWPVTIGPASLSPGQAATPLGNKTVVSGRQSLVDRIQADFPRTPSPVYAQGIRSFLPCGAKAPPVSTGNVDEDFLSFSMGRLSFGTSSNPVSARPRAALHGSGNTKIVDINASNRPDALLSTSFPVPGGNNTLPRMVASSFGVAGQATTYPIRPTSAVTPAPPRPSAPGSHPSTGSPLLEDFRMNKLKKLELGDIQSHVVEFSGDQHGSRFIQQKLEACSVYDRDVVFRELLPQALNLMTDVFGNYVIQKYFEHGSPEHKVQLAKVIQGHILSLSLQMYGCRVVQKALEFVPPTYQAKLVSELDGHVLRCVKDQNGNHVIQKCIECVPSEVSSFVVESFKGQVYSLATHPYGCRVIQRIFEYGSEADSRPLIEELHRFITNLVQDQYGNYVVQHVIEKGSPGDKHAIIERIKGNVLVFSRHKFASNVVEKCISFGGLVDKKALINEVLELSPDGSFPLLAMMKDQFANYVVQRMLDVVDGEQRELLLQRIGPHLPTLRRVTYGKHIIVKVEKLLGQTLPPDSPPRTQK